MQNNTKSAAIGRIYSGIVSYLSSVFAFTVVVFVLTVADYLTTPHTSGGWGPPAGLMFFIGLIQITLAGVGLISPPIVIYIAIAKGSRLVAAAAYLCLMACYIYILCAWYSPWIPLRQNMGTKITEGGIIWMFVTVYGIAVFWSLLRPTLSRLMMASAAAFVALGAIIIYIRRI